MKKEFTCKNCNKQYYSYKENSHFCSNSCRTSYRKNLVYNCDYCGVAFVTTEGKLNNLKNGKHKHLFCSRECADKFMRTSVEKKCENCGNTYMIYNAFKDVQKYCSRKCYKDFRSKKIKIFSKICPVCNNEFETYHENQIYCSKKCNGISNRNRDKCICDYCGKEFDRIVSEVKKNNHHYCSIRCKRNAMYWSKDDVKLLIQNYGNVSREEIVKIIPNWTYDAIKAKAYLLGLGKNREWSEEEINILKDLYPKEPMIDVLSALPNRTMSSVLAKARTLGLLSYFYLNNAYSPDDDCYLKKNYLYKSNEELAKYLNRTTTGIAQHLNILGLHRPRESNGYTNLNRYARSRLNKWKQNYKEFCRYTCEITGTRSNIIVHHIRSFNLLIGETIELLSFPIYDNFDDYTQEQLDLFIDTLMSLQEFYSEYICITESIHIKFHNLYGYGNNTKEQWDEFICKYYDLKKVG